MVARVHVLAHSLAGREPGSVSRCQLAVLLGVWAKPIVVQSGGARQSDSAPGGVAIRTVGMRPVLVQEETVEYEVKAAERESSAGQ
jgi:hypothetical protein